MCFCQSLNAVYYHMSLSQTTCMCCGQLGANLFTFLATVSVLSLTLSQASVQMSSLAGCNGVGLVHWSGPGRTRIHSDWN